MGKSADVLTSGGGFHGRALDDHAGAGELPQGDEQLAGEGDNEPLARGFAAHAGKPLTIPSRQRRLRLMDEPQPGELKQICAFRCSPSGQPSPVRNAPSRARAIAAQ